MKCKKCKKHIQYGGTSGNQIVSLLSEIRHCVDPNKIPKNLQVSNDQIMEIYNMNYRIEQQKLDIIDKQVTHDQRKFMCSQLQVVAEQYGIPVATSVATFFLNAKYFNLGSQLATPLKIIPAIACSNITKFFIPFACDWTSSVEKYFTKTFAISEEAVSGTISLITFIVMFILIKLLNKDYSISTVLFTFKQSDPQSSQLRLPPPLPHKSSSSSQVSIEEVD